MVFHPGGAETFHWMASINDLFVYHNRHCAINPSGYIRDYLLDGSSTFIPVIIELPPILVMMIPLLLWSVLIDRFWVVPWLGSIYSLNVCRWTISIPFMDVLISILVGVSTWWPFWFSWITMMQTILIFDSTMYWLPLDLWYDSIWNRTIHWSIMVVPLPCCVKRCLSDCPWYDHSWYGAVLEHYRICYINMFGWINAHLISSWSWIWSIVVLSIYQWTVVLVVPNAICRSNAWHHLLSELQRWFVNGLLYLRTLNKPPQYDTFVRSLCCQWAWEPTCAFLCRWHGSHEVLSDLRCYLRQVIPSISPDAVIIGIPQDAALRV